MLVGAQLPNSPDTPHLRAAGGLPRVQPHCLVLELLPQGDPVPVQPVRVAVLGHPVLTPDLGTGQLFYHCDFICFSYQFTHVKVIINVHLENIRHDVPELTLLHPEPLGDEGHVAGHGDGGQLPVEVCRELPVHQDGRLATLGHVSGMFKLGEQSTYGQ